MLLLDMHTFTRSAHSVALLTATVTAIVYMNWCTTCTCIFE